MGKTVEVTTTAREDLYAFLSAFQVQVKIHRIGFSYRTLALESSVYKLIKQKEEKLNTCYALRTFLKSCVRLPTTTVFHSHAKVTEVPDIDYD